VSWRALHLDDVEAVPGPAGLAYKPVRLALGLRYGLSLVHRAEGDEAGAQRWLGAALELEPGLGFEE
jgi:hypothetical protein